MKLKGPIKLDKKVMMKETKLFKAFNYRDYNRGYGALPPFKVVEATDEEDARRILNIHDGFTGVDEVEDGDLERLVKELNELEERREEIKEMLDVFDR